MKKQPCLSDPAKEFKKIVESAGHRFGELTSSRHRPYTFFSDWLHLAACALHQEPYHLGLVRQDEQFNCVEAEYMAIAKKYNREELDAFATLLGITKLALCTEKTDFLGQVYMALEIANSHGGEFFTPFEVSLLMARLTLADAGAIITAKGYITLAEPACGAGGMLIAAAKALEEDGHDPAQTLFFAATDIAQHWCDMTYIQTSILGLFGLVQHGNTLSGEVWSGRFTPICRFFPARFAAFLADMTPTEAAAPPTPEPSVATPPVRRAARRETSARSREPVGREPPAPLAEPAEAPPPPSPKMQQLSLFN